MAYEVVQSIRQAEENADGIKRAAVLKAQESLRAAADECGRTVARATQEARAMAHKRLEEARNNGQAQMQKQREDTDLMLVDLEKNAREKWQEAQTSVMERIVK